METIIDKPKVLEVHRNGNSKEKELLEKLFGTEPFAGKITDRVKSVTDALRLLKISEEHITVGKLPAFLEKFRTALQAQAELLAIAEALNEGWTPDWTNSSQEKWYPWFLMNPGFGFSGADCDRSGSSTGLGSRLYFRTAELAKYAGQQFEDSYKRLLTNKP